MQMQLLTELRERLMAAPGESLMLTRDKIDEPHISDQWQTCFGADSLSISNARISEQDDGNFTVSGNTDLLQISGLEVEITFFLSQDDEDEKLECFIDAKTFPVTWNLSAAYPNLPGYLNYGSGKLSSGHLESFFKDFDFKNAEFIFCSFDFYPVERPDAARFETSLSHPPQLDGKPVKAGINLGADLSLESDFWSAIKLIDKGLTSIRCYCNIQKIADDAFIALLYYFADTSFHLLPNNQLPFTFSRLALISGLGQGSNIYPSMVLSGSMGSDSSDSLVLDWFCDVAIGSDGGFTIRGNFEQGRVLTLDQLENLLGLESLADELPFSVGNMGDLGLAEVSLDISMSPPRLDGFSVVLAAEKPWSIIEDKISFAPNLIWKNGSPPDGRSKETILEIAGTWMLGYSEFGISVTPQTGQVEAQMAIGSYLDIGPLFENLLPGIERPEVQFLDLDLSANFRQKTFSISVDVGGEWSIDLGGGIALQAYDLFMSADYDENQQLTGSITGTLDVGGWEMSIDVELQEQLSIECTIPDLNVSDLLNDLLHAVSLPAQLPDFVLNDFDIRIIPSTGAFDVQGKSPTPLEIFPGFRFTMDYFRVTQDEAQRKTAQMDMILWLGDVPVKASATYKVNVKEQPEEGTAETLPSWDFIATAENRAIPIGHLMTSLESLIGLDYPLPIDNITIHDFRLAFNLGSEEQYFAITGSVYNGKTKYGTLTLAAEKSGHAAAEKPSPVWDYIFSIHLGDGINLSNLPLVGREFTSDQTVSVDDLQIIAASKAFKPEEISAIGNHMPSGMLTLPARDLETGFNFSASVKLGNSLERLALPISSGPDSPPPAPTDPTAASSLPTTPAATGNDAAKWFTLQKSFGPVYLEKVGVLYRDATISFLLDAALSAAGLTLSLEGLSISSPLTEFSPKFDLQGLGIDFQGGAVEIGGAFLRTHATDTGGAEYDEYDGTAVIKTDQFSLSAIGSYAKPGGHPSLFVYGVFNYPIGGPAFFYVTGLAAGFGFNRALVIPPLEDLAQFPLVAEATSHTGGQVNLETELTSLSRYIPPAIGQIFLAVGVKFTSFKMIDSFALLTLSFGSRVEINLLGLSTLIVPTPVPNSSVTPLAEAQMALRATFIPDEGFLGVSAQLTPASYILSRDCHLTGGYAFYSWFSGEHEGDFVQTLGGYHPSFNVPAHYPKVPRLGFTWRVSDALSIKGGLYYALTTSTLMAGGFLQAVWEEGDLSAWFNVGADFLISWKPYHYDARIYVDMGVSYSFNFFGRHTISVDIGADLHIWGPEFAGHAHIHLSIISFDVEFGRSSSAPPPPIDWPTFRSSFLPENVEDVCGITVKDGLVRGTQDGKNLGVINPTHFSVVTNSVIPSNGARVGKILSAGELASIGQIGIGSMAVSPADFSSTQTITIKRDSKNVETEFEFTPVLKNVPAGLWGRSPVPDINGQALIEGALTGFEIKPKEAQKPVETAAIERRNLQYSDPKIIDGAFQWEPLHSFKHQDLDETQRRRSIKNIIANDAANARKRLLETLGVNAEIDLNETVADDFLAAPVIEA